MIISSDRFDYDKQTGEFFIEASDVTSGASDSIFHMMIVRGSCNFGITVQSVKTNKKVDFYITEILRHDDEIEGWKLKPTLQCVNDSPELARLSVVIAND